jgi:hypothetical protein
MCTAIASEPSALNVPSAATLPAPGPKLPDQLPVKSCAQGPPPLPVAPPVPDAAPPPVPEAVPLAASVVLLTVLLTDPPPALCELVEEPDEWAPDPVPAPPAPEALLLQATPTRLDTSAAKTRPL